MDIPTSAWKATRAGLWIGEAVIDQVGNVTDSTTEETDSTTEETDSTTEETDSTTAETDSSTAELDENLGSVQRPFRLRLIIHAGLFDSLFILIINSLHDKFEGIGGIAA